jgi:hypothetical protein
MKLQSILKRFMKKNVKFNEVLKIYVENFADFF